MTPIPCPTCGQPAHFHRQPETLNLGSIAVTIDVEFYRCESCGEEFTVSTASSCDSLAAAYERYREITGKEWKGHETRK